MFNQIHRNRSTGLALRSLGVIIGIVVGPSLAHAEDDMMQMPMGQMPAATAPQSTTSPQQPSQNMPNMQTTQPGVGSGAQGQGMGMGMMPPAMQNQMMGMMGMMGMAPAAGAGQMGAGQGMADPNGKMGGMQNRGNQVDASPPMGGAAQPTTVGAPDATRLYHVGSIDFFLDQAGKLNLTSKQTTDLTEIKRLSLARTSELQTKIVQSEQQLFSLTGADAPNEKGIANKVKEIEKLRTDQRLDFIKSVGRAGKVLSADQRQVFLSH